MIKRDDIKIHVISAREFKDLMKMNGITEDNVETFVDCAMIEINDPNDDVSCYFKKDHANVIRFFFYDVTELESQRYKAMDKNDAEKMFAFIKRIPSNPKIKHVIVHCHAGISRSGAVGTFIQEYLGIDYRSFIQMNPQIHPNSLVKSLLIKAVTNFHNNEIN